MVGKILQSRTWELVNFTEFDGLQMSEGMIDARTLGPKDVLVKLVAVSLNYRDLVISRGLYPFPIKDAVVPASDGTGLVVAVGDQVDEFHPEDRVITLFNQGHQAGPIDIQSKQTGLGGALDGTLRDYAIFPESGLVAAPKNLNWEEASTLCCAGLTSWNALFGMKPLKAGDYVLIQGTGGVSLFALQFAKAAGACVVAITSSEEKAKKLRELGADNVINYTTQPNWGEVARLHTPNGAGFDHIIEVGGSKNLPQSISCIKHEGVVDMIGFIGGEPHASTVNYMDLLSTICTLRGIYVGSRALMKEMIRAIEIHDIHPVLDNKVFKFEEVKEAYQYMWEQKHFGKLVIRIDAKK